MDLTPAVSSFKPFPCTYCVLQHHPKWDHWYHDTNLPQTLFFITLTGTECDLSPGIVSSVNETAWNSTCIRPWRSLSSTCKSECLQEQSDLSPTPNQEANARCSGAPSVLLDRAGAHLFLGLVCTGQKSFLTVVDLLKCLCSLKRDFILLWEVSII